MQDLQSIVLGIIAGLLTNYIQKEIETVKGTPISIEMLTKRFWGSFISAIVLALIFPQIDGTGWYLSLIRFILALLTGGCFWGCISAFNTLVQMYNDIRKKISENKTENGEGNLSKGGKEISHNI